MSLIITLKHLERSCIDLLVKKLSVLLLLAHSVLKSSNINSKETKIDNCVNTKYLCKPILSDNRTQRLFHNAFSYSQPFSPFSPHIREIYKSKNNKHCLMTSFKQSLLWNQSLSLWATGLGPVCNYLKARCENVINLLRLNYFFFSFCSLFCVGAGKWSELAKSPIKQVVNIYSWNMNSKLWVSINLSTFSFWRFKIYYKN